MKSITQQQEEVLLTSEEEVYMEGENKNDGKYNVEDESNLQNGYDVESTAGVESDLSSSLGPTEITSQRGLVDDTNVESLSVLENSSEGLVASAQDRLQTVTTSSDVNSLGTNSKSLESPLIESVDGSYMTSSAVVSKTEERLDVELNNAEASSDFDVPTDFQDLDSLGTANAALETDSVPRGDIPVASKEDNELQEPLQFPDESNIKFTSTSSSKETGVSTTVSSIEKLSADEQNDGSDAIGGRSVFKSQSPSFSTRGIPAPSLLSAARQVSPGKVLVPAVADQTQSQALMALQVLKVCFHEFL